MTELLTAAQMRAIERAAIDSGEVTGLELMERAGQSVVEAIFEEWPELAPGGDRSASPSSSPEYLAKDETRFRAIVLCGPGNNGGDGFVAARLLHKQGWAVDVFLYGDAKKLPPDALVNYERWLELGEVGAITPDCLSVCKRPHVIIDAILGTGLKRPLPDVIVSMLHWLLKHRRPWQGSQRSERQVVSEKMVCIDIPSGICADSGAVLGRSDEFDLDGQDDDTAWPREMAKCVSGALTVAFHSPKLGHYLEMGTFSSGKIRTVDIGLRGDAVERSYGVINPPDIERARLLEPRFYWRQCPPTTLLSPMVGKHDEHKFHHGHALMLSGGISKTGAARLAARGALRIGAGLVSLGVPASARQEAASQLTAIMLQEVDEAGDLSKALKDERINALCLGPALGLHRAKDLVTAALEEKRATVLDADALSAFADDPDALFMMLHENCILTPHGGEFARLFPDISEKLNEVPTKGPAYSKVDATREAAKRAGCVVLFKGVATVIAAADGRCSINSAHYERSAPWLATAGSGDVLAGFITGLLARGFTPMQAAETAAWLHVECALKFGPGLIAEDIAEQLPAVFRDLGV